MCRDKKWLYKTVNTQVANERHMQVPKKPGGCNRNHNSKALEHPTGLPNLQPSHEPPSGTHHTREGGDRGDRDMEGTSRTAKLQNWTHKCHTNRLMNMLQAHGMITHELTQKTAGQSQPHDTYGHVTAANAMEHTNAKQTLIHGQDAGQRLQRTPLTRLQYCSNVS